MNTLRMVEKVKDTQGKIIACKAIDNTGKVYIIEKKDFRRYQFTNVIITKDLKIKQRVNNYIELYHGSHTGIVGSIRADKSRAACDFGKAFYTGDNEEQAKTLIVGDELGVFYKLRVKTNNLKVYKFTNEIEWAMYVGVKRGYINTREYNKLYMLVKYIDSHDVVVGPIADDRMSVVYPEFIKGAITDVALINALKHVKYGNQYVFKNNAACKQIEIVDRGELTADEKKSLSHNKNVTIGKLAEEVEEIKRDCRRKGRYIDEILKQWR